ncbi:MAG TPA: BON domain-containing protein [Methylophilaceae bacterium]
MSALTVVAALYFTGVSLQASAVTTDDYVDQSPLAAEFKKLDSNHDGKLTREEASRDQDLLGNFARADTNSDGVLAVDEYSSYKSSAQQKRVEGFLDDSTVTAKVKSELVKDAGIKGLKISVETYKGEVILSGFVENEKQLKRAIEIASGIRGVQSVKNGLVIKG